MFLVPFVMKKVFALIFHNYQRKILKWVWQIKETARCDTL